LETIKHLEAHINNLWFVQFYLEPRDRVKKLQDDTVKLEGQAVKQEGRRGFFTTNIGETVRLSGWPASRTHSSSV